MRAAKTVRGPITQPMLVGQANTSPGWMSWYRKPSEAALIGVVWSQGIALGSPVVPEEKRMIVRAEGSRGTGVKSSRGERKSSQERSPGRSAVVDVSAAGTTTARY